MTAPARSPLRATTATTASFQAFGHRFRVRTLPALAAHLEHLFADLRADDRSATGATGATGPAGTYRLERDASTGHWHLWWGDDDVVVSQRPSVALDYLIWHVNRCAIDSCDHVAVHASAATDAAGRAVVLPATMESGKTTLVAGLVRAGLGYLTDEAVAFAADGSIVPFAKPLSVDEGSWGVLADLRPDVDAAVEPFVGSQWQVAARDVGPVAATGRPVVIVTPTYDPTVSVELEPMSAASALLCLAENSFNLPMLGRAGFDVLAEVARTCRAYRLRHGDLTAAVAALTDLLATR